MNDRSHPPHRLLTRRLAVGGLLAAAGLAAGCGDDTAEDGGSSSELPAAIREIIEAPAWATGRWGLHVADAGTGEVIHSLTPTERFLTGSTAKVFSVTAALAVLGADHRFETPVVHTGTVTDGTLEGDLVLRASGDLTLGGRARPDGTLDVPDIDHIDANALPGYATLSPQDPLAGLDALAAQVRDAGVTHVAGDVLVDDRLWEVILLDDVPITPIVVNDNLLDFVITPGAEGEPATFTWRPETAAYTPVLEVTTGPAGGGIALEVVDDGAGGLTVKGSVPAGAAPVVHTYQPPDPATWARTLFIEALERAGVTVDADPLAPHPTAALPSPEALDAAEEVARLTSPPFSEIARLINKPSHNLGANQLPFIMGAREGKRTHEEGLAIERAYLEQAGLDPALFTISDGQGLQGNTVAPEAMADYLRFLTTTPTFQTFFDSTPILGVDGTLKTVLPPGDPAIGHGHAKTGTIVEGLDDGRLLLRTKALAGYVDAASGRRLAIAIFVNDVEMDTIDGVFAANDAIGTIASILYESN